MQVTQSDVGGIWETAPFQVNLMADREVWTIFYEGDYQIVMSQFGNYRVGDTIPVNHDDELFSRDVTQSPIVTGIQLKRKKGGLMDAVLQITRLYEVSIWGVDFAEVSKDVKTWLVEKMGEDAYPWLTKIAQWENYKTNDEWEAYQKFKCGENEYLTGDALTLAKKILKGVTNYSIYIPVVTRTTTRAYLPEFYTVGYKEMPLDYDGFTPIGGVDPKFDELANEWLKTGERAATNGDSTFTFVESWTGCDLVDPDLYPSL